VRNYLRNQSEILVQSINGAINWKQIFTSFFNSYESSGSANTVVNIISQSLALTVRSYVNRDLELIEQDEKIFNEDSTLPHRSKVLISINNDKSHRYLLKKKKAIVVVASLTGAVISLFQIILLEILNNH
jgi:histidyl-tRNA synthetase